MWNQCMWKQSFLSKAINKVITSTGPLHHKWAEFASLLAEFIVGFLLCSKVFSLVSPVFLQKNPSNLVWNLRSTSLSFIRLLHVTLGKQSWFILKFILTIQTTTDWDRSVIRHHLSWIHWVCCVFVDVLFMVWFYDWMTLPLLNSKSSSDYFFYFFISKGRKSWKFIDALEAKKCPETTN